MDPIEMKLAYVVDVGEVVSLFGFDPQTGSPTAVYVEHRPWEEALQRLRAAPSTGTAFVAKGLTLAIDFRFADLPVSSND
jgi:hypothetical protein